MRPNSEPAAGRGSLPPSAAWERDEPASRGVRTLLAVAYFFPPLGGGGVQRTVKFVKYLRPLGWRSEIITVRAADYWVLDPGLAADIPPDTVIHRTHALTGLGLMNWARRLRPGGADAPGRNGAPRPPEERRGRETGAAVRSSVTFRRLRQLASFFLIPDAYAGWFPFALEAATRRLAAGGVDALLTTSSPDTTHLVGLALSERHPVPWIADFRDPWVRRLTFSAPTRAHERLHLWLEKRVLEAADRVIVTNDETRNDFLERHPRLPAERLVVIPNGYDPEDLEVRDAPAPHPAPRPATDDAPLVLTHTGLLSGRRTLGPLLAGIERLLAARPGLRSRLRVRQVGPRESVNDDLVLASGLEDVVTFLPPVDHRRVLAEMAEAGALLLLEADEPRGSLITPGKIFEYLASGRPLLALVPEGPASALVRAAGGGQVLPPGDAGGISEVLARWIDQGPPLPPSRAALLAGYARPTLAARLAALLDEARPAG